MSSNLDKRLAVWLNTYRDTKYLYDELTARTADKWLDDYPEDITALQSIRFILRDNLIDTSKKLCEIFGSLEERFKAEAENE